MLFRVSFTLLALGWMGCVVALVGNILPEFPARLVFLPSIACVVLGAFGGVAYALREVWSAP
jgi:uncharacterized membrane protein YbaN (DUF454 family)